MHTEKCISNQRYPEHELMDVVVPANPGTASISRLGCPIRIDLKSPLKKCLVKFWGNQQDLDICLLISISVCFDTDLYQK